MAQASLQSRALLAALNAILQALARLGLRHGVSCQQFLDLSKRAYVEVGMRDFGVAGRKTTISRVAVLTGLTRKEIHRLLSEPAPEDAPIESRYNRAAKVVAGWVRDPDFADDSGAPGVLAIDEGDASFAVLVRRYSGDMPARAVLDELERVGTVQREADGRVRLLVRAYIPSASSVDKLQILGADVAALVDTIDHNLQHGESDPRFQRKVMYDNVPEEALPEFRRRVAVHTQTLIEEMDRWLAHHDRDVNPAVQGTGRMCAGLGAFYFEHPFPQESNNKKAAP